MYRQRGLIHIGQIATGIGTGTETRSVIGQRMTGETAVVILSFVGTPSSAATVVLQLLVVAAESGSAPEIESRTDGAAGLLAAGVGLAIE